MFERLPECLIIEILSWLPIKSLFQLKSVNKLCYNIIKSPYFISKHLKRNNDRHNNCIIAQFVVTQAGELEPSMVWLDDEIDEDNTINSYTTLQNNPPYNYNICGPCDGLYYVCCLWMGDDWPWSRAGKRCLWNPALNQFKTLPPVIIMKPCMPSNIEYHYYHEYCGVGFDPITADYKVVLIKGYKDSTDDNDDFPPESFMNYPLSVLIYSLRNDSWRYVRDLSKTYYLQENYSYTLVNTSYYWLGSNDEYPFKYDVIIIFNLATEAIEEIELPETRLKDSLTFQSYSECLMVYGRTIALVALYKDEGNFDIWTLEERSWSKQLSVQLDGLVRNLLGYRCFLGYHPIRENMVLFRGWRNKLVLYYLDSKESSVLPVIDNDYCRFVATYMESLVPLNDDPEFWLQWENHRMKGTAKLGSKPDPLEPSLGDSS
ncbi:hypothetical protein RND81_11G032200 [Saponaria officinalis]|uniref:F-box domain-containing protein n=1 Tax=Saponaria officinalis TaxID=3572 RepID=A0AAW1HI80_SAPOF